MQKLGKPDSIFLPRATCDLWASDYFSHTVLPTALPQLLCEIHHAFCILHSVTTNCSHWLQLGVESVHSQPAPLVFLFSPSGAWSPRLIYEQLNSKLWCSLWLWYVTGAVVWGVAPQRGELVYEEPKLAGQNDGQWQLWKMWFHILLSWNVLKLLKILILNLEFVKKHFFQPLQDFF